MFPGEVEEEVQEMFQVVEAGEAVSEVAQVLREDLACFRRLGEMRLVPVRREEVVTANLAPPTFV